MKSSCCMISACAWLMAWAAATCTPSHCVAQWLFPFSAESDFSHHFAEAGVYPGNDFGWSALPGAAAAPGRVEVLGGAANEALVFNQSAVLAGGKPLIVSALYLFSNDAGVSGISNPTLALGVVNAPSSALTSRSRSYASLSASLVSSELGGQQHLALRSIENGSATASRSPALSLAPGWYELSSAFQWVGGDGFEYVVRLEWRGLEGSDVPVTMASLSGVAKNSQLSESGQVWFALAGGRNYGALAFDNVLITVPEPTSLGVFALAGSLLAILRRKRRSA